MLKKIKNTFVRSAKEVLIGKCLKLEKTTLDIYLTQKSFDLNCKQLQTNLQRLGRKLSKTLKNPYSRVQFFKLKRKYSSTNREEERNSE